MAVTTSFMRKASKVPRSSNLSAEERDVLILHAVAGMKFREAARFMEIPLSSALSKYHRAIKKIRSRYGSNVL